MSDFLVNYQMISPKQQFQVAMLFAETAVAFTVIQMPACVCRLLPSTHGVSNSQSSVSKVPAESNLHCIRNARNASTC